MDLGTYIPSLDNTNPRYTTLLLPKVHFTGFNLKPAGKFFVSGFSTIAISLFTLTKKDVEFVWSTQYDEAFQKLKDKLVGAPVLA